MAAMPDFWKIPAIQQTTAERSLVKNRPLSYHVSRNFRCHPPLITNHGCKMRGAQLAPALFAQRRLHRATHRDGEAAL